MSRTTLLPPELGGITDWLLSQLRPRFEHKLKRRFELSEPHATTSTGQTYARYNESDPPDVCATTSDSQLHLDCLVTFRGGENDGEVARLFGAGPFVIGSDGKIDVHFFVATIGKVHVIYDRYQAGKG